MAYELLVSPGGIGDLQIIQLCVSFMQLCFRYSRRTVFNAQAEHARKQRRVEGRMEAQKRSCLIEICSILSTSL
jgi:hypothetical protein